MSEEQGKVKITVLKTLKTEELFKDPIKTKQGSICPNHKEGQIFYYETKKPEGFCTYAWGAIWPFVMALSNHSDFQWLYEDPGVAVTTCPDGLRPVIFKLELVQ